MRLDPVLRADYEAIITDGMNAHPRSAQKMIGPSEVGDPCDRKIGLKLSGAPTWDSDPSWQAWVGTQAHEGMSKNFEMENERLIADGLYPADAPRYLIEQKVFVGMVGDKELTGHSDLYDRGEHMVIDWKFPGAKKMARLHQDPDAEIEEQYSIQAQCYARGQENAGHTPKWTCIAYLPASGKLEEAVWKIEKYDRQVSEDVLARLDRIQRQLDAEGPAKTIPTLEVADNFCKWCSYYQDGPEFDPATECRGYSVESKALIKLTGTIGGLTIARRRIAAA